MLEGLKYRAKGLLTLILKGLFATFLLGLFVLLRADDQQWINKELFASAQQEFGVDAKQRLQNWQELYQDLLNKDENEKLRAVNYFFNNAVNYVSDDEHWGQKDYWATPYEILTTKGADCEDFVIAKYYTLKELGIEVEKLRITYVKALRINQAHMVLTYFPTPDAIPLVLDNLIGKIYPADRRTDLEPVYSFNASGMWLERMKGKGIDMGSANKLDLWTDLRFRMSAQGMEI
ncbi:MAG: putative transglutaminase-like cysteine proteinase [Oleispira sp.]